MFSSFFLFSFFSPASAFSMMLHHISSASCGDWKNTKIIYASPANCSGLPKCRVPTRSHPEAYSGKAVRVVLPLRVFVFPRTNALLSSLPSGAVGEMVQAKFSTQIDAAAARLMKVCSEPCGDAAAQGCVTTRMMLGCSGAVALPLPLFLSLPLVLTLTLFLSRSVISHHLIRLPAYQNGFITLAFLPARSSIAALRPSPPSHNLQQRLHPPLFEKYQYILK